MTEYVFDTEAIIAYLYNEPGHENVASKLDAVFEGETEGSLSENNASDSAWRLYHTVLDK
jgi:predicted nucleic acid-binding protein